MVVVRDEALFKREQAKRRARRADRLNRAEAPEFIATVRAWAGKQVASGVIDRLCAPRDLRSGDVVYMSGLGWQRIYYLMPLRNGSWQFFLVPADGEVVRRPIERNVGPRTRLRLRAGARVSSG